jgi:hypothetical protein
MYNQFVDDQCLQFRSVPMAVVNKILKPNRPMSEYTGVKRVFNNVPARPINLNALATTIARMGNMPYSQVDAISMRIAEEEVREVKAFVKGNKDPFEEPVGFAPQEYVPEKAVRTTLGVPLRPTKAQKGRIVQGAIERLVIPEEGIEVEGRSIGQAREVSLLLGDEAQTYNTPPMSGTVRTRMKMMDEPREVDFYSRPQFIEEKTFVQQVAEKRTKNIMMGESSRSGFVNLHPRNESETMKYLGIEPVPQVGHTTKRMDGLFGPAYQKNLQEYYPVVKRGESSSKNE